jgi:acyl-CoA dehydrogenase
MDFEFPADTLMLRDMLRRFLEKEARPLEMNYFNTGELASEDAARLRRAIDQLGLWGVTVPEEYGGGGLDLLTSCVIDEELGKTFVPVEIGDINPLLYACNDEQIANVLEPVLAGEARAIVAAREPGPQGWLPEVWTTRAQVDGDDFVISGRKLIQDLPGEGDTLVVFARTQHGEEPDGFSAFLLAAGTPGVSAVKASDVVVTLDDCRVGSETILGGAGKAFSLASQAAAHASLRMGARYVGITERLIEMAAEHMNTWVSFGAPLNVRPAALRMLAEMRVSSESVRWLVYHAAWLVDSGRAENLRSLAAQVRLASGEMLRQAVDKVTMIFAGPGPAPEIDPHRYVSALVPAETLDTALEQARMAIAADVLNLKVD